MTIQMSKFNTVLNGRPAAKEAILRIFQIVNGSIEKENVILDFSDVEILTPSYADELLRELKKKYNNKVEVINTSSMAADTMKAISD